jgi:hypothetical protein
MWGICKRFKITAYFAIKMVIKFDVNCSIKRLRKRLDLGFIFAKN